MFFYGVDATKKPTAAPLGADNTYRRPFLCPQEESDLRAFFSMSRSAFSFATSRFETHDLELLGLSSGGGQERRAADHRRTSSPNRALARCERSGPAM